MYKSPNTGPTDAVGSPRDEREDRDNKDVPSPSDGVTENKLPQRSAGRPTLQRPAILHECQSMLPAHLAGRLNGCWASCGPTIALFGNDSERNRFVREAFASVIVAVFGMKDRKRESRCRVDAGFSCAVMARNTWGLAANRIVFLPSGKSPECYDMQEWLRELWRQEGIPDRDFLSFADPFPLHTGGNHETVARMAHLIATCTEHPAVFLTVAEVYQQVALWTEDQLLSNSQEDSKFPRAQDDGRSPRSNLDRIRAVRDVFHTEEDVLGLVAVQSGRTSASDSATPFCYRVQNKIEVASRIVERWLEDVLKHRTSERTRDEVLSVVNHAARGLNELFQEMSFDFQLKEARTPRLAGLYTQIPKARDALLELSSTLQGLTLRAIQNDWNTLKNQARQPLEWLRPWADLGHPIEPGEHGTPEGLSTSLSVPNKG